MNSECLKETEQQIDDFVGVNPSGHSKAGDPECGKESSLQATPEDSMHHVRKPESTLKDGASDCDKALLCSSVQTGGCLQAVKQ